MSAKVIKFPMDAGGGRLGSADRAFAASPSSLSPQSRPYGLQSHDAAERERRILDVLFGSK